MKLIIVLMLAAGLSACGTYAGYRGDRDYRGADHRGGSDTVTVCHKGKKTMELPQSAVDAHLGHGDWRGRC